MENFITFDQEMATTIALDLETNEFIMGEKAKILQRQAKTGIFNFKSLAGDIPTELEKKSALWYLNAKGEIKTITLDEALKIYFKILNPTSNIPRTYFVGVPSLAKNRAWIERYKSKVSEGINSQGTTDVKFIEEPVAVFEYYRDRNKLDNQKRYVLVLDIGGSTFNCCIIEQKGEPEGAKVVAMNSSLYGGTKIDERLLIEALTDDPSTEQIDNPEEFFSRRATPGICALSANLEIAKIELSKAYRAKNMDEIQEILVPEGVLSECFSTITITQAHLREAIKHAWSYPWFTAINELLETTKSELNRENFTIGAILFSGGSSKLPLMNEHAKKALTSYVTTKVLTPTVKNIEKAVAYGISATCKRRANLDHGARPDGLQQFFTGELFVAIRRNHAEEWQLPKFSGGRKDGQLFSSAMNTRETNLEFDIVLPFKPSGNVQIGLFSKSPRENLDSQINVGEDVFRTKAKGILNKASLKLEIREDAQVLVELSLKTKKKNTDLETYTSGPWRVDGISLVEGFEYIGLDFGHSNTYMTRIVREASNANDSIIPSFKIDKKTRSALEKFYKYLTKLEPSVTDKENLFSLTDQQIDEICYHSNKLETLPALPPEEQTDDTPELHNENISLKKAYKGVIDKTTEGRLHDQLAESPMAFIRNIHSIFGEGWLRGAGAYREKGVKANLTEHEYIAPALIESELRDICDKYRDDQEFQVDPLYAICKFHIAFEMIHPFDDGNGRIGRLILDSMCLNAGIPAVIISSDRRQEYLDALSLSNTGDASTFVSLVLEHVEAQFTSINQKNKQEPRNADTTVEDRSEEFFRQKARGENPLKIILQKRRKKANDLIATQYDRHIANLEKFDELVNTYTQAMRPEDEAEVNTDSFFATTMDTLTEQSFKRYQNGNQKIKFRYKKLVHTGRSEITDRKETREFYFECQGEEDGSGLLLNLMTQGVNDTGLTQLSNTHIKTKSIVLYEDPAYGLRTDGEKHDLETAVENIFWGAIADNTTN